MDGSSKYDEMVRRCQELEIAVRLWMAANEAKAERIQELEALCAGLQQRAARLGRRAQRSNTLARQEQIRDAR